MKVKLSVNGRRLQPDFSAIGQAVRQARRQHGLTQVDLAGLSGTSQRFISELESGVRNVTLSKVADVLAVLGLHLQVVGNDR